MSSRSTSPPPTPPEAPLPRLGDESDREPALHRFVPGGGMQSVSYDELKAPPRPARRRIVDLLLAIAAAASVFAAISYVRRGSAEAPRTATTQAVQTTMSATTTTPSASAAAPPATEAAPEPTTEPSREPAPSPAATVRPAVGNARRPTAPRQQPAAPPPRAPDDPWGWKR